MKARPILTDRQKYFGAMLQDQVAFMRYFFKDEITIPPSTRQKLFWNDVSKRVLLATGRKTGKTLSIEAQIIRNSLAYRKPNRLSERMFATPGDNQMKPTQSRLMTKIEQNPLFKAMKVGWNKNDGMLHWKTNVVWHFRIDGTAGDDRNMVGLRLDQIVFDEGAFTSKACHSSRKQSALPGCTWIYAGVPNSVRHTPFWELDQMPSKGKGWSHHKTSTYANPLYQNDKAKDNLIEDYGKNSPDYTTQVMGAWGVELFSSFPFDSIAVNDALPYRVVTLRKSDLPRTIVIDQVEQIRLASKLQLPKVNAAQYIIGQDYGSLQDPTEIIIAYRESLETQIWKALLRIEIIGVDALTQAYLLHVLSGLIGRDKIGCVCIDLQHAGRDIAMELTKPGSEFPIEWWQAAIIDFNANGIVEVQDPRDEMRKIKVRRKEYFTDRLKIAFLVAKANLGDKVGLWLGHDDAIVQELMDTREQKMASGYVIYIPRSLGKNQPVDHATDALRALMAAAMWAQDNTINEEDNEEGSGWAGNPFRKEVTWKPMWERELSTSIS